SDSSNDFHSTIETADNYSVVSVTYDVTSTFSIVSPIRPLTVSTLFPFTSLVQSTVIVEDTTAPTITAPAAVTVSADANCEASNVALGTPVTADNCSVASVTNDAPATFPLGSTIVTWTVTDGAGLTATAEQTVIVEDTTAPTITAPAAVTVSADANCEASNVAL